MDKILDDIGNIINEYESGTYLTADRLRELLRLLSSKIYFLTKYKIEAKNKHNSLLYIHNGSVASGQIIAHEECPELYQLRYIIKAAQNVCQSMIMEISIMRKEN